MFDWINEFFKSTITDDKKVIVFIIVFVVLIILLSVKGKGVYDRFINIKSLNNQISKLKEENNKLHETINELTEENHALKSYRQDEMDEFYNANMPMSISEDKAIQEIIK